MLGQSPPAGALHVHEKLYEALSKIGAHPNAVGHVRADLADESLRVYVVFSYLIVYLPDTKPVQVIRVIHGARDLPAVITRHN